MILRSLFWISFCLCALIFGVSCSQSKFEILDDLERSAANPQDGDLASEAADQEDPVFFDEEGNQLRFGPDGNLLPPGTELADGDELGGIESNASPAVEPTESQVSGSEVTVNEPQGENESSVFIPNSSGDGAEARSQPPSSAGNSNQVTVEVTPEGTRVVGMPPRFVHNGVLYVYSPFDSSVQGNAFELVYHSEPFGTTAFFRGLSGKAWDRVQLSSQNSQHGNTIFLLR